MKHKNTMSSRFVKEVQDTTDLNAYDGQSLKGEVNNSSKYLRTNSDFTIG